MAEIITRRLKPALFVLLLLPFALLLQRGFSDQLGANPVEVITHETGLWALRLLLLTLAVTPLCRLSGINAWIRLRRMIGLYSFFYALLHFTTYALLDHGFDMAGILADVLKRPYITFGFITFLLLIPLAVTSSNRILRKLGGQRWKRLHRLVYLCGLGGVLHYLWLVKADTLSPLIYLALFLILMLFRLPPAGRDWLRALPSRLSGHFTRRIGEERT